MGSGFGTDVPGLAMYCSLHGDIARDQKVHNHSVIEQNMKYNLENRSDFQEIVQNVDVKIKEKNPNFDQVTLL